MTVSRFCDGYDANRVTDTHLTLRAGGPQMTGTKFALVAGLCDRTTFDNAAGEAFWTLDDDYDPTGHPKRHGRVRGHVREV